MFATIIVVLPSEFAGGSLHLSHGGLSTVIDLSADSALGTSVASWYTDVMHEVKPVTSGYRLALSYNLLHTTNELRPSLSSSVKGLQLLRHVLLSWQQTLATAAKKLIYLLDYKYAQASLKGSALKGKDAHIVAMLYALSPECQIGFGLASIECYVNGSADDDFGHHHRGKYRSYADDDDDVNPGMGEVIDRTMSITGLVDMDGRVLVKSVDAEEDAGETIPLDLRDTVESGAPDNEEYEGYQGNVSTTAPCGSGGTDLIPSFPGRWSAGAVCVDLIAISLHEMLTDILYCRVPPNCSRALATEEGR